MARARDISIGKGKTIKWIGFDPSNDTDIFEIDDLLKPSFDFWDQLETQCMAAAVELTPTHFGKKT